MQDRYWRRGVHRSTRKRLAAEIDEQLRRDGYVPYPLLGLRHVVEAEMSVKLAEQRNRFRNTQPAQKTLAPAITNGAALAGSVEAGMLLFHSNKNSVVRVIEKVASDVRSRAAQQEHLSLDLRTLRDAGLLADGREKGWILDLLGVMPDCDRAVIIVDLKSDHSRIVLAFMRPDASIVQTQSIEVARENNLTRRFRLICPIAGTAHDQLFFRDGFFASAKSQRLVPQSQL